MNKKQQTLNPEAAVEMVIKMQDRQTNAIEILSGLILQFEQINYVLHKIDEATCETGKGVDDAWNMLKNREGIWQGANIVQTYMSSFEKNDFPRITSHVFRHTFATRAIEAGMPPQVLKTILGHSSLAMTMDLYSHVLPDTKADEMQKIANVF